MSTVWDLNSILLNHTNRFFHAATLAVQAWADPDEQLHKALMRLSGSMLWAGSPFLADSRRKEKSMAYGGALASSMADIATKESPAAGRATAALATMEHQLRSNHDAILVLLERDLASGHESLTPAQLNAAVWKRLFPEFSYGLSLSELGEAIRAWLMGSRDAG